MGACVENIVPEKERIAQKECGREKNDLASGMENLENGDERDDEPETIELVVRNVLRPN